MLCKKLLMIGNLLNLAIKSASLSTCVQTISYFKSSNGSLRQYKYNLPIILSLKKSFKFIKSTIINLYAGRYCISISVKHTIISFSFWYSFAIYQLILCVVILGKPALSLINTPFSNLFISVKKHVENK